jgi:hypothetical protein
MAPSEPNDVNEEQLDVRQALEGVVAELRAVLATEKWVLVPNPRMTAVAFAAGGLAHAAALAEAVVSAHDRGEELVGRILARALFETWLVAYYLHHGGVDAVEALSEAQRSQLELQRRVMAEHDEAVRHARKRVRAKNRRIAANNARIVAWNEAHPDTPKPLLDLLPGPPGVLVDWSDAPPVEDRSAKDLSLLEIVAELRRLTRAKGTEETFEASYHLAYRGLSNLGAHANLFVFGAYLDNRNGRGNLVRIRPTATVRSSFEDPNLDMALLLVAGLSVAILESRGADCPLASAAVEFYNRRIPVQC